MAIMMILDNHFHLIKNIQSNHLDYFHFIKLKGWGPIMIKFFE